VNNRKTFGGTAPSEVERQIANGSNWLNEIEKDWR